MLWSGYLTNPPAGWDGAQHTGVRDLVKDLIALRTQYSALRRGDRVSLYRHNDDGTFAYRRTDGSGSVLVALNNSNAGRSLNIPNLSGASLGWSDGTVLEDKLSGQTYTVSDGHVTVNLSALQGAILVPATSTQVTFTVHDYVTQWGQSMYVVGNVPELGNWDPAAAAPLSWVDSDTWSGVVPFIASRGQTIEYKYIVRQDGNTIWESGGNRTYAVPASGTDQVQDYWRH
jgi:alpha-amylase